MAEIKLNGWSALAAGAVLAVFSTVRVASMGDMRQEESLAEKVKMQLMSEYLPDEIRKVQDMIKAGAEEAGYDRTAALAGTDIEIKELKVSYPVYVFSTGKREGVVKVRFTMTDPDGVVKDGLNFYTFEYQPIGKTWYIRHACSESHYYMKFLL